eukprot:670811-Amphidinium_carterae.1
MEHTRICDMLVVAGVGRERTLLTQSACSAIVMSIALLLSVLANHHCGFGCASRSVIAQARSTWRCWETTDLALTKEDL